MPIFFASLRTKLVASSRHRMETSHRDLLIDFLMESGVPGDLRIKPLQTLNAGALHLLSKNLDANGIIVANSSA